MRGNLLGEHVEVRLNLTFGRSQNILFIMSLLFVSSPIRFTIGILIDSFRAGAWLGNKCRAMCVSDDNEGGRGNLYVGRGCGSITKAYCLRGRKRF